jgi:hypothetical protein
VTLQQRIDVLTAEVDRLTLGVQRALDLRALWEAAHPRFGDLTPLERDHRRAAYLDGLLDALEQLLAPEPVVPRVINPPDLIAYSDDPADCGLCLTGHWCHVHGEADLA